MVVGNSKEVIDGEQFCAGIRLSLRRADGVHGGNCGQPIAVDLVCADHRYRGAILRRFRPGDRPSVDDLHDRVHHRFHSCVVGDRHVWDSRWCRDWSRSHWRVRASARCLRRRLYRRLDRADRDCNRAAICAQCGRQDRRPLVSDQRAGNGGRTRVARDLCGDLRWLGPDAIRRYPLRYPDVAVDLRHYRRADQYPVPCAGTRASADAGRSGRAVSGPRWAEAPVPPARIHLPLPPLFHRPRCIQRCHNVD